MQVCGLKKFFLSNFLLYEDPVETDKFPCHLPVAVGGFF